MFSINFNTSHPVATVSQVSATEKPVLVVVDVTSLKALDVRANDLFSVGEVDLNYYFVTIEDFDKIGFHLTKISFEGDISIVFCTGSESGEIVYYDANMSPERLIGAHEEIIVLDMPAVQIAADQKVGLQAGTKVGVSEVEVMPAVALQAGQSVNVGSMPAVSLEAGQSVNVKSLPAVSLASGQKVGLDANTKVAVSAIDTLPQVQIAPNQGVNVNKLPDVTLAANQEVGLKAGSTVGIDGAIQATIANDQAIGVYPVRRN